MNQLNLKEKLTECVTWLNLTLVFLHVSILFLNPNSVSTTYQCLVVVNALVHVIYLSKMNHCLLMICNNQLTLYLKKSSSIFINSALWICLVSHVLKLPYYKSDVGDEILNTTNFICYIVYVANCFYICAFTDTFRTDVTFYSLFLILLYQSNSEIEIYMYEYITLLFLLFATFNCLTLLFVARFDLKINK